MSHSASFSGVVSRLVLKAQEVLDRPVSSLVELRSWGESTERQYVHVSLQTSIESENDRIDLEMHLEEWLLDNFGVKHIEPLVLKIVPVEETEEEDEALGREAALIC